MKENNSEKHHTIPQFYLNSFATKVKNGYWINVYDKNLLKDKPNLVKNIGYIKNFNTININGQKTDLFEKLHNEVFERKFSVQLKDIIKKIENYNQIENNCYNCMSYEFYKSDRAKYCINYNDKKIISCLLSYFILRGRKIRKAEETFRDRLEVIYKDMYNANGYTDTNKIQVKIEEQLGKYEDVKKNQLYSLFNGTSLDKLGEILYNHIWIVGYSDNKLLYTSDNGHALTSFINTDKSIGYSTYDNIIFFPLTPKICIMMYDEKAFKEKEKDLIFANLNEQQVNVINENIIFDAIDEIYSINNDWKLLEKYYKREKLPKGHKPYNIS